MSSVKLPCDLEEEIVSRLPPRSLVRLRSVCKHWNDLFNDKRFVNDNLARARPQFIFLTESKSYSIDIIDLELDPKINVHEVPFDFPFQSMRLLYTDITYCDGLLFREFWRQGVTVWNPWLRQGGWIEYEDKNFHLLGVGYDSTRLEKSYKMLGYFNCSRRVSDGCQISYEKPAIYDCASHALKFIDVPDWPIWIAVGSRRHVSLNGNLYWLASNQETNEYFIGSFDFSTEILKPYCLLPCGSNVNNHLLLSVFKSDQFALLKRCCLTRKIEIWVTKNKINEDDVECVVWSNYMTFSMPSLPILYNQTTGTQYFIFDKTLIICSGNDETGAACIFIVREDMCKKIQIDYGICHFDHCVYVPNVTSVPLELRSLQV